MSPIFMFAFRHTNTSTKHIFRLWRVQLIKQFLKTANFPTHASAGGVATPCSSLCLARSRAENRENQRARQLRSINVILASYFNLENSLMLTADRPAESKKRKARKYIE